MIEHFKQLLENAKDGNREAIKALMTYYNEDEEFQKNPEIIVQVCRKEAEKGNPAAKLFLSECLIKKL